MSFLEPVAEALRVARTELVLRMEEYGVHKYEIITTLGVGRSS
jgi:hypothetical protein